MGRLKLLNFGFGFPELYLTDNVVKKGKGEHFANSLRNVATKKGLAYLVSPQIGQFWRIMILLKTQYLRQNKWYHYKNTKSSQYKAYINMKVVDRSQKESQVWQQCPGYPGLRLKMLRSSKVKVQYETQKKFEQKQQEYQNFESILMQQAHDYLQGLDPLLFANDIQIIDQDLRKEHLSEIQALLTEYKKQRVQKKIDKLYNYSLEQSSQINPYKRIKSFKKLRRQIIYSISQKSTT